jgi:hypothetical protein
MKMKIKRMKDFLEEDFSPVEREKLIHSLMGAMKTETNRDIIMEELEWLGADKLQEVADKALELISELEA